MSLYNKVRQKIEDQPEDSEVDLSSVFSPGVYTPPPTLNDRKIPMAFQKLEAASASVSSGSYIFQDEKFCDLIVDNLVRQNVRLTVGTWFSIIRFFEETNFRDRLGGQIRLESLLVFSKLDVEELYLNQARQGAVDRNWFQDYYFRTLVEATLSKETKNEITLADDVLTIKIKVFLKRTCIVGVFRHCLDEAFAKETEHGVEEGWVERQIENMRIYTVNEFWKFRGVTLTDGILICLNSLVNESTSQLRHDADLYTISCHEASHFLARMLVEDYNFSSNSSKCLDGETAVIRMDSVIRDKGLEMGRAVEQVIFDKVQPDWETAKDDRAAAEFIANAVGRETCPPPLLTRERMRQLNLFPRRIGSCSFAADLRQDKMYL